MTTRPLKFLQQDSHCSLQPNLQWTSHSGARWLQNGPSRGSQSRWRCAHQSARGQRNEVFRALEGRQMSPRCGCTRDERKMERGGPCSTCNVPLRQVGVAETVASVVVSVMPFASSSVAVPIALHALGGADGCAPDLADLFAE